MVERMVDSTENEMALTTEALRVVKWEGLLGRLKVEKRVYLKGNSKVGKSVEATVVLTVSLLAVSMGEKMGVMKDSEKVSKRVEG